jgi:hypothetical protein
MNKKRNVVLLTLFYTTILSGLFFFIALHDYQMQVDKFYHRFETMRYEVVTSIKQADIIEKNYGALLETDNTYRNQVMRGSLIPKDINYMTPFIYTYKEIFTSTLIIPREGKQYSWPKYIYANTKTVHLSDIDIYNIPSETIVVGSRYGYSNTENSGVVGVLVDLKTLINSVVINQSLSPENIVISTEKGSLIYHADFNNVLKPTINEIYTYDRVIDTSIPDVSIQIMDYRGEKYIRASKTINGEDIELSLIMPWSDVFFNWQVFVVTLTIIGIVGAYIIFINVKRHSQLKEIKRIYNVKDRSFTHSDFEKMTHALQLRNDISHYLEFELNLIIDFLGLLKKNTLGLSPTVIESHETFIINYMQRKMKRLRTQENNETYFESAPLERFESVTFMNRLLDYLRIKAHDAQSELITYIDDKANQTVYGYPNAIWISSLYVLDQLLPYQDKIYITLKLRGELTIGFRTIDYIKYDEVNIKKIGAVLKTYYQIDFMLHSREIVLSWPVVKKGHLPNGAKIIEKNVVLCGYRVDTSTERSIKHFVDQEQMTFESIRILSQIEGIVLVSTEQLQFLTEDELDILKTYPDVVLLYPSSESPYVWAERINAVGILVKPLKTDKLKQMIVLIQQNL